MLQRVANIIKREIEFMFGRRIVSSRDCIQLSDEIFRITRARLNANTLRRFFGLVKTHYSPSSTTIQILCNYCGFVSLEEIKNQDREIRGSLNSAEQKSLLNFLVMLFKDTTVENDKNETFKNVVKQVIVFLNQRPDLVDQFQLTVAKLKYGQEYYFEGFVHIDRLNSYYGNGLRYYLNEKNDPEAQIFAHSLLVFRYWLTENAPKMDLSFEKLNNLVFDASISYNASGRYFASKLYYEHAKGISSNDTVTGILNYNVTLENIDLVAQLHFELTIAEALILTGHYEEGLFYCDMALKKIQGIPGIEDSVLYGFYVLQAFAMYKKGDEINAGVVYGLIKPTSFSFLNKKMQTILYGFLTEKLRKNAVHTENQLRDLILETGFSRFERIMRFEDRLKEV